MNCAPCEVTGGSAGDDSFFESLPHPFMANIAGECTTGNGVVAFPDPGRFGKMYEEPTPGSSGSCPEGIVPVFEEHSSSPSLAVPLKPSPPANSTPAGNEDEESCDGNAPNELKDITGEGPGNTGNTGNTGNAGNAGNTGNTGNSGNTGNTGNTENSGNTGKGCAPDGSVVCLDPGYFGICNRGTAVPQLLAAGQVCVNGVIGHAAY